MPSILTLSTAWCTLTSVAASTSTIKRAERFHPLPRQAPCSFQSTFQLNEAAWTVANTDAQFQAWWDNSTLDKTGSKSSQLAAEYGPHLNNFACGISLISTCTQASCDEFASDTADIWAYFVINSIVNMNNFFNKLYTGVTNGQVDYVGLTGLLAEDFFPWKEPIFSPNSFVLWVTTIITSIATFGSLKSEVRGIETASATHFVSAAGNQLVLSLSSNLTLQEGIAQLGAFATQTGEKTRQSIEQWVNTTFYGQQDAQGHTLRDYIAGGSFLQWDTPLNSDIEAFYRTLMVAKTVNLAWSMSESPVFIMFANTTNPDDSHGPSATKYYSAEDGGVYYMYSYYSYLDTNDFHYKGHLTSPPNIDRLNNTAYNISIADILVSSSRAWKYAGNNYTEETARNRIITSISSNGTLTPFQDGPSWEGIWTVPICDIGNNVDWNTQFGDAQQGLGRLPCCCGKKCKDTAEFVYASGFNGSVALLEGCKKQLKGTGISFNRVNYGFKTHFWSAGRTAGFIVGLVLILVLLGCCACCSKGSGRVKSKWSHLRR